MQLTHSPLSRNYHLDIFGLSKILFECALCRMCTRARPARCCAPRPARCCTAALSWCCCMLSLYAATRIQSNGLRSSTRLLNINAPPAPRPRARIPVPGLSPRPRRCLRLSALSGSGRPLSGSVRPLSAAMSLVSMLPSVSNRVKTVSPVTMCVRCRALSGSCVGHCQLSSAVSCQARSVVRHCQLLAVAG